MFSLVASVVVACLSLSQPASASRECTTSSSAYNAEYTPDASFLTYNDPTNPHGSTYDLRLSDGRYGGDYPDCISLDGSGVKELGATGRVQLDAFKGQGSIEIQFEGSIAPEAPLDPEAPAAFHSGNWSIVSNGVWLPGVPFQRNGISENFIQHGCTGQGEPGFPMLKAKFSTWGGCDVYLNGSILYENVWLHTMYTNRMRAKGSNAIWADAAQTEVYSPEECWKGAGVDDDLFEFSAIVSRWCSASSEGKVHQITDLDIVLSFTGIEDVSVQ